MDLSHFIHEELFLLDSEIPEKKIKTPDTIKKYIVGVIANSSNEDDLKLLGDILRVTKIDASRITFQNSLDSSSERWLIFSETFESNQQLHRPTEKFTLNSKTIILAHPLEVLRNSKAEKAALWLLLKEEFGL